MIAKDLIKELITKQKYEDYLRKQDQAELDSKRRKFVSASEVNEILRDEVAATLVESRKQTIFGKKERDIVNISVISDNFNDGEIVNLDTLEEKNLLNKKANHFKVLAGGTLNKALTVEANEFSIEAVKMILLTGGKAIKII